VDAVTDEELLEEITRLGEKAKPLRTRLKVIEAQLSPLISEGLRRGMRPAHLAKAAGTSRQAVHHKKQQHPT
jgi:hypothetical protein